MSKLDALVGKVLERIEAVHDYNQLYFGEHLLNVYNPMLVIAPGGQEKLPAKVAYVKESDSEIVIMLEDSTAIRIDLTPSAWLGPEALALYCASALIAVWT